MQDRSIPAFVYGEIQIKNLFRELYDDKNQDCFEATKQAGTFLPFELLNSYSLKDFPNAKMNWLIKESVEPGSQLLWIPPSMPYYKLEGPFQGKEGFFEDNDIWKVCS